MTIVVDPVSHHKADFVHQLSVLNNKYTLHQWLNFSKTILPLASGTFPSAFATALMIISLTETLMSCFSVNLENMKHEPQNNRQPTCVTCGIQIPYLWAPF